MASPVGTLEHTKVLDAQHFFVSDFFAMAVRCWSCTGTSTCAKENWIKEVSHRCAGFPQVCAAYIRSAVISAGTGSPPPKSTRSRDPFFVVSGKGVKPAIANNTTHMYDNEPRSVRLRY
jgi:hypothetical protein